MWSKLYSEGVGGDSWFWPGAPGCNLAPAAFLVQATAMAGNTHDVIPADLATSVPAAVVPVTTGVP